MLASMTKQLWKPGNMLYPLPAVMLSCGDAPEHYNIMTVSWTGTICSDPAMLSVSIRPERHSYSLIKDSQSFVVNLVTKPLAFAADWCGVKSGREYNKFKEQKLTPLPASKVACPMIKESPVNMECQVTKIIPLGSHDLFLANIVAVHVDEKYLSPSGVFQLEKADLICYSHGFYYTLGQNLGHFGFSVKKKK